jgi:DNA invertase Pin-like site-specific DNA recombinase
LSFLVDFFTFLRVYSASRDQRIAKRSFLNALEHQAKGGTGRFERKETQAMQQFIEYLRVSTASQGASGLGLEAQKETIRSHLGNDAEVLASYVEVESGRRSDRVELSKAIAHAKRAKVVLVIARLDRLARSARFLLELVDSNVEILFCDLPQVSGPAGRFLLTSMAGVAELEAGLISERTRAALKAARARGVRLGNPEGAKSLIAYTAAHGNGRAMEAKSKNADARAEPWRATLQDLLDKGLSYGAMARELDGNGDRTPRGSRWSDMAVSRMIDRLGLELAPA